jgi:photosystem II stability/assembly factor-like uncharacterized protein
MKSTVNRQSPRFDRGIAVASLALLTASCAALSSPAASSPTPQSSTRVAAERLLSETQGWALSDGGLFWTNDAGLHWAREALPNVAAVSDVAFLNQRVGWAVSLAAGTASPAVSVYATHDSGQNWQGTTIPLPTWTDYGAAQLQTLDSQRGWLLVRQLTGSNFSEGFLFRTGDAGATWTQIASPTGGPFRFVSPDDGWAVGTPAGDRLYVTHDGGLTWQPQLPSAPTGYDPASLEFRFLPEFSGPTTGVLPVVIRRPDGLLSVSFYTTTDGGQQWLPTPPVATGARSWAGLAPSASTSHDWALFAAGQFFVTHDAASTWSQTAVPSQLNGVVDLDFISAQVGWAQQVNQACPRFHTSPCLDQSQLFRTVDGGVNWQLVNPH